MFSRNGKISEKQLRRMIMLTTFAGTIFVLPYLSATLFGTSYVWGLLLFFVISVIYISGIFGITYMSRLNRVENMTLEEGDAGESVPDKKRNGPGFWKGISVLLVLVQILRQILHLSFYIVLSIGILGEAQVPFMEGSSTNSFWNLLVVLPLIFVALYGANHNVEKVGRLFEMLFWAIFIPFVIMILFGLNEVDYAALIPVLEMPLWKLLLCSYALVAFVVPMEQFLFLSPSLVEKEKEEVWLQDEEIPDKRWLSSYGAGIFTVGLSVVLTLFILGIYGVRGAAMEEMVTVDIMRYIRLPLGVLERFDVLMVWFFMLGCFILICSSLFFGGHFASQLKWGKKICWLFGMIGVSLLLVLWLPDYRETVWMFLCYGAVIDVPLSILLPVVETLIPEKGCS